MARCPALSQREAVAAVWHGGDSRRYGA